MTLKIILIALIWIAFAAGAVVLNLAVLPLGFEAAIRVAIGMVYGTVAGITALAAQTIVWEFR